MGKEGQGPYCSAQPFLGQRGRQGLLSPCSPGEQRGQGWPRPPPMSPHTKERRGASPCYGPASCPQALGES